MAQAQAQAVADQPAGLRTALAAAMRVWRRHLAWPSGWLVLPVMLALLLSLWSSWTVWQARARAPQLTVEQMDVALRDSIAKQPLRSAAALAYEAIIPSVVRVVAEHDPHPAALAAAPPAAAPHAAAPHAAAPHAAAPPTTAPHERAGKPPLPQDTDQDDGRSVGTGVVIVDKGVILTNLHVVAGADRIKLTFWDGSESRATVKNLMPEHDLAVLQAHTIPDDLHAATLRSTTDLQPGDEVLAVGFPFGIGPSASTGVVSGLKREFRTGEGRRSLSNLIQFDAAANPGNSGGPLVTMDGHVVGIVTAIMNPNAQRTFIGIGFAVPIENAAAGAGLAPF
jgi:S1-C subfamily serine protease